MFNKPSSLKLALFALIWLCSQSAALQHEISSEHLNANYHHICLAQAAQLDDLINAPNQPTIDSVPPQQVTHANAQVHFQQAVRITPYLTRAPPQINLV
jgi:hydroxyacyl-ACP dehydratase HTD2-like protein with hotdog domain